MKNLKTSLALLSILALAVVAAASGALRSSPGQGSMAGMNMSMAHSSSAAASSPKAVQLRLTLDQLLGEHAILAIQATQRGYAGGADFSAVAKQLDANSVALSKAIASVYGAAAGKQFLDGKNLWRAHIKYFVDYTVALAKHNSAQREEGGREPHDLHPGAGCLLREGDGAGEGGARQRPDRARVAAEGSARRVSAGNYAQAYALTDGAYKHCS